MAKYRLAVAGAICLIVLVWAASVSAQGTGATLTVTPVDSVAGDVFAVTADKCPDPDGPRLGGDYQVRFQISYLRPADAGPRPEGETSTVRTEPDGTARSLLTVVNPPGTKGYLVLATCELKELGGVAEIFGYGSVEVSTAEPTGTPEPTATVGPTATPEPTATVGPTGTPEPTATSTPAAGSISFTG